jgi:hypothetical protein
MRNRLVLLAALAATALLAVVPTATANNSADALAGARCVKAGVTFLVQNGLLRDAALTQIDYDTIDSDGGGTAGLINTDLPAGSYLSLGTVIRLHFTNPELFDWCA